MTLSSGSRIGPYEISSLIGAGGMGEVFRAVDINLGRPAAIKVLPASLAGDPDRLARFEREAQTLASLNHPNIAQVFGFEKGDGNFRALAMEFVDGPTLADRIGGMPMPIDDALAIAVQVADALESAHDHGVIHRDLKPLNIKVRPDGAVKVLDFGLAKALTSASESGSGLPPNSPTITTPAMTNAGVVLGTASYMSPEQAKGRVVDRRADIWAFGCVLFEMLTGKRAFGGSDVSDVFVSILRDEPQWSTLPAATPPSVRSLLQRCLQKDVRKRLPHIGIARLELSEPTAPAVPAGSAWRSRAPWIAAGAAALIVALGLPSWMIWSRPDPAAAQPVRVRIDLGTTSPVSLSGWTAVSPDGKALAFTAAPPGDQTALAIYVRHLDRLDAQLLPGTEGGQAPFFSPDSKSIGFFAQETLKKVTITGGPAMSIAPAPASRGGWWGDDGRIVFASADGLSLVSASGGTPDVIVRAQQGQAIPTAPQLLPGGRGILYSQSYASDPSTGEVYVHDFRSGSQSELLRGGRFARYTRSGHLTFTRGGILFAVPFDLETLAIGGETVPAVEGVFVAPFAGRPNLALSDNGTLVYQPGAAVLNRQLPVMWLTQTGQLAPLRRTPASFAFPRFAPDGRRIAMAISDGRQTDIWVYDWERDILTRITTDPSQEMSPVWTRDGTGLVFTSNRNGVSNVYWRRADGTGPELRLTTNDQPQMPNSFDPDGRLLVLHEGDPVTSRQSLMLLPIEPDGSGVKAGTPRTLVGGAFLKANGRISPDGKWIAYAANDTGTFEIYVQPFPGLGERVQVSASGGNLAVWSPTANELYYTGPNQNRLMVVPYSVNGTAFVPARAREWSHTVFSGSPPIANYGPGFDIHPDGKRFAVTPPSGPSVDTQTASQLVIVFNFLEELRRLAPAR